MLLRELKATGTYVAVLPTESTSALLKTWAAENKFELADDLHVTVLYSRTVLNVIPCPDEFVATGVSLEVLGGCLVLKLECPALLARHKQLLVQGGTHDFSEYIPHITLQKETFINPKDVPMPMFGLILGREYSEPLKP